MKSGANVNKMKPTAQRLSEVYCRPKGSDEWATIRSIFHWVTRDKITSNSIAYMYGDELSVVTTNAGFSEATSFYTKRDEIPVSRFIDLIQDAICAWRLEDDGFQYNTPMIEVASYDIGRVTVCFHEGRVSVILDPENNPWNSHVCNGVKTYTDLITLIELIG